MSDRAGPSTDAWARGQAYALLAKLLLEGLDADTLELIRKLPSWLLDEGEPAELEPLAAEQHSTFHLGVFPYAGVFLDRSAIAGAWADQAFESYERAGFRPRLDEVAGDHLGVMLAFLAFASPHSRFDAIVAEFLDSCVLSWVPALVVAADALGEGGFWPRVLHAALELCAQHRIALPFPRAALTLAPHEDLLAHERTGLRQIAEHLLTPAASGVFLSRADLARLGRTHELPRGFGARLIMLDNLLRSAVEHDRRPALLASLDELLVERDAALDQLADSLTLAPTVAVWRSAIARTRELARRVAAETNAASIH